MLGARLATAAVAIPILLAIIFGLPPWGVGVLIFVLGSIAVAEYMTMAFRGRATERALGGLVGIGLLAGLVTSSAPGLMTNAASSAALVILMMATVWRPVDMDAGLRSCAITWLGISYVGILAHFAWLRHLPDGSYWITFVIAVGMASDTGAYFAGRAFGRRKLLPRVSPNKTIEGAVGNLLAGVVVGALGQILVFPDERLWEMVILAVLLAAVGQVGDLCESLIKRAFGAKESGNIFPGHGGVLDRIDSLLFPVAILYYYRALT